jgi:hypothetical protein
MTTATSRYGEYLLVLSGLTEHAPFLENWRTLKDSVRRNAGKPGWTDVATTSEKGARRAWCNLSRESNAEAAYGTHYDMQT